MPAYDALNLNAIHAAEFGAGGLVRLSDGLSIPKEWCHPDWLRRRHDWRYFELSYKGGREYIESKNPLMLFSHEREDSKSYADRCRRAYLRNHVATILGLKSDAIYQPQVLRNQGKAERPEAEAATLVDEGEKPVEEAPPRIKREQVADPTFDDWLLDVDGRGTNADPFWSETARWAMCYGVEWVGITMSAAPMLEAKVKAEKRIPTVREVAENDVRELLYRQPPASVINWSCDPRGRLEWVVALMCEHDRVPLPEKGQKQPGPRWYARVLYRDREERFLIGADGKRTPAGVFPHAFGEVPLVPVAIFDDWRSQVEDIARLQNAWFNNDSMIEEQIFRQTFNQLVGTGIKDPKAFMDNISGTDAMLVLGEGENMQFLAPDVNTIAAIRERNTELIDDAYGLAALRTRPGSKGAQPASDVSGVAYAFEHKEAETSLASIAKRLEEAEAKLLKMRARSRGLAPEGTTVQYPQEFDIRALQARVNEAKEAQGLGLGPTAEGEMLKNLVRKALPRLPAGKLQKIDGEIEEAAADRAKRAAAPPIPPPGAGSKPPPDQSMQPPGTGAAEDRMQRPPPEEKKADEKKPPPPKVRARRSAA